MFVLMKELFWEHQPTVGDAYRKAQQAGWQITEAGTGYTLLGVNASGQPDSWQFGADDIDGMNYLLDAQLSMRIGEQYRLQKYGPDEPADSNEATRRRHEIRDFRIKTYYRREYQAGWRRLLGMLATSVAAPTALLPRHRRRRQAGGCAQHQERQ